MTLSQNPQSAVDAQSGPANHDPGDEDRRPVTACLFADATPTIPVPCPHCAAGEPSVWDDVLGHYAHHAGAKLKMCHAPWRERCRRCSADITHADGKLCAQHMTEAATQREGP